MLAVKSIIHEYMVAERRPYITRLSQNPELLPENPTFQQVITSAGMFETDSQVRLKKPLGGIF